VIDIELIDLTDFGYADADTERFLLYLCGEGFSLFRREAFGIIYSGQRHGRRKYDGGGDYGSCQRTYADFVDPGDVAATGSPENALEVEHGVEPKTFRALFFVPLLESLIKPLYTSARIPPQLVEQACRNTLIGKSLSNGYDGKFRKRFHPVNPTKLGQ
jgi:hypothetical protein